MHKRACKIGYSLLEGWFIIGDEHDEEKYEKYDTTLNLNFAEDIIDEDKCQPQMLEEGMVIEMASTLFEVRKIYKK